MKKKILRLSKLMLVISIGVALLFVGCKATTTQETTAAETTAAEKAASAEEEKSTEKPKEPVKLKFWNFNYGDADKYPMQLEKLADDFMKANPGIEVEIQMVPWENWLQTLLTAASTDTNPDISISPATSSVMFAKMGDVLSLNSIVDAWKAEKNPILDDFYPGTIETFKYGEDIVGFPWLVGVRGINYRTDVFEELGITELPKNWDDFLKICRTIRDKTDYVPLVIPSLPQDGSHVMMTFMFSNDVGILTKDATVNFDTKNFREVLSFIETLYTEGLIPEGTASYRPEDVQKMYYTGKAAMMFCPPFLGIAANPEYLEKTGVLPTLAGPSGTQRGLRWDDGVMVFSNTKHPDEAKLFVKYFMENNLVLYQDCGNAFYPLRKSYYEDPAFQTNIIKLTKENVIPYAAPASWPLPYYDQIGKIDGERILAKYALEGIIAGTSYDKIISDLNENVEDMMKD